MKNELRLKMRKQRGDMPSEDAAEKSAAIRNTVFSLDCVKNAGTVCTYISAFKEPDTMRIIERLLCDGKAVAVPVTDKETKTLSLSFIDNTRGLKKGAYGIPEPVLEKPADMSGIDAILVPGLAFDRNGARLGFGMGYYDKLLQNSDAVKIGLCYDFQLFDEIPSETHDVKMDIIVTERTAYYVI